MANSKAFHKFISSNINLLFLKSTYQHKVVKTIRKINSVSDHYSDWFEPGTQLAQSQNKSQIHRRRSNRRKNLHQKLVMSQMSTKKAAKLDMDDRAKIVQYFTRPVNGAGDISGM